MPRPVLTKADFVKRYALGEFGNASPTWDNLREFRRSGYKGLVHVRNRVAGARTWYNVPPNEVQGTIALATSLGFPPDKLYISAMAPTEKTLLQGEVRQSTSYLDLRYTTVRKPMRDALAEEQHHAFSLRALSLLRVYLCPSSFSWLEELLEGYSDHVIEFSTFSTNWGTIPGYNTVFWEVRAY